MEWLIKRVEEIQKACEEVEKSNLSNEAKTTILKVLKEEINLLYTQKERITNELNHVLNGFSK